MTLKKELCLLIEMHCKDGYHKHSSRDKSYKTLARQSNVPVTTIQNWMNINTEPTLVKAQSVLQAMGYELVIKRVENEI